MELGPYFASGRIPPDEEGASSIHSGRELRGFVVERCTPSLSPGCIFHTKRPGLILFARRAELKRHFDRVTWAY
jgi:hypothetical protein